MRSISNQVLGSAALLLLVSTSWAQQTPRVQQAKSTTTSAAAKPPVKIPAGLQFLYGAMPISTKSLAARNNLEMALEQYENASFDEAILHAQLATEKDPNFALGYAVWSFVARRSSPAPDALKKAKALAGKCYGDECLMITFLVGSQEANVLPAISAMNDLLSHRPKDKHVLYLSGEWLYFQQDYDHAKKAWIKSLEIDPDFPPALNMLGYVYVEGGEPEPKKAIEYLKHYAAVLPKDGNPQDSLGEILRMTGDDSGSLAHYAEALEIDPKMITSRYGRGDTYALMGNYFRSKSEYEKALKMSTNPRDTIHIQFATAMLNFWTNDVSGGREELRKLAEQIAKDGDSASKFEVNYARALLAVDLATEQQILEQLGASLSESLSDMPDSDRNANRASVLREQVRIAVALHESHNAATVLQKLQQLADSSSDQLIQSVSESAKGYVSLGAGDYAKATEQLSADLHSPLVVREYLTAVQKLGDAKGLEIGQNSLKYRRTPTAEWYLAARNSKLAAQITVQ
jgi:tetratricopeptide (TPR) repeat protein